ncbi:hypothetical protein G6Z92_06590 [Vibrio aestuarianus subsp. cardii]|uniref:hypothetical protein n=1 Tax=Vibrio aestuarianus TaxID=28171 RepID=UPI0015C5273F|nr:hypothetical protein [Vibrio aestuarianus]NGZ66653.1 hypothetical protein [Vibrio aestuarianus subsp. cardii]
MTKPTMQSVEGLIRQLLKDTKELGITLTGVVATPDKQLLGFDNRVHIDMEQVTNIRHLVEAKGELNEFLLKASQNEAAFSLGPTDEFAVTYTETNPQVFTTLH